MTQLSSGERHQDATAIRLTLKEVIRRSSKSRCQIAEEMSVLLRRRITERMLNCYTAESREDHPWPCELTIAFCHVLNNYDLLKLLALRAGLRLIGPEEESLIEIGNAYIAKAKAERKLAEVEL